MRRESTRGGRGWFYAILVAICLLGIFYYGVYMAQQPRVTYRDPRTTVLTASNTPKNPPRIATDNIPLDIEPLERVLATQTWTEYRSDYTHSIAMLEPPAGVKLMAPISLEPVEPFVSPSATEGFGPDPLLLANDEAKRLQNSYSLTSVAKELEKQPPELTGKFISTKPSVDVFREPPVAELAVAPTLRKTWPQSPQLASLLKSTSELGQYYRDEETLKSVQEINSILESLVQYDLKDPESKTTLEALRMAAMKCVEHGTEIYDLSDDYRNLSTALMDLAYAIERRTVVWVAIHDCIVRGNQMVSLRQHYVDSDAVLRRIATIEKELPRTGDPASWQQYLMLDAIKSMAKQGISGSDEQVAIAREFLARVLSASTSDAQRAVLTAPEVHGLADLMHPLTIGPVDYVRVLSDIETLEIDPTHRSSKNLAEAIQSLRFSEHPEQAAISHAIAAHYRNANIRIAVSEEFLNRMLPEQTHTQKPVRQNILGADTRGASQIATQLRVDVQPSDTAWRVNLRLKGDIASNTKSSRGGATFYNTSRANVESIREIQIRPDGFHVDGQPATVQSNDSLRNFSTEWDQMPLIGDIIRGIAHQEFMDKRPVAKRIMQSTIAKETDKEFDKQLNDKLVLTQQQLQSRLIAPLQGLDLHPMITDMQSTDTRLIVRYRVASESQVGAHTVRPIAPSDSVLSMQVHQSALNNIAAQIATSGREWTAQELSDQISDLLQQPRYTITDEQAEGVKVSFHANSPITFEFKEGKVWLTLRIDSLEQPGRIHLKNFVIRTAYVPSVRGLAANLTRESVISVDGTKLGNINSRDRIALRAIFNKILSDEGAIPMVAESLLNDERAQGLSVSQLELHDGWLAIAISESNSAHVAALQGAPGRVEGNSVQR